MRTKSLVPGTLAILLWVALWFSLVPAHGSAVLAGWEGLSFGSTRPADMQVAAGTNGVIQTVKLRIAYFDKSGAPIWGEVGLASHFFSSVGATTGADAVVMYDPSVGRFYVIMQESPASGNQGFLDLAVSKTSNPTSSGTSDWYFYRFDITEVSGGIDHGGDFGGLGFDNQALYVTFNMHPLPKYSDRPFLNCQILTFNKTAITSGSGSFTRLFTANGIDNGFSLRPATVTGTNSPGNVMYFGETPFNSSDKVRIWALSDPLGTPALTSASVTVPDNGGQAGFAPQSGTSIELDTVSGYTQGNAFWYNGSLWFCHTAGGTSGRSKVYYYKVNSNNFPDSTPTLAESESIDGGPGVWTYIPAIGGNALGDVCIVFSQSSASTFPAVMSTTRAAAAASFDTPVTLKMSPNFYNGTTGVANEARWGDWAGVGADPVNNSFWVTHEWAKTTALEAWGTWVANVSVGNVDSDGDGFSDLEELQAGTDPLNPASAPGITSTDLIGSDVQISFSSVAGKKYLVESNPTFPTGPWTVVANNVVGTGGTVQVINPGAAGLPKQYYRVQVSP
ncbi:MAG: thrombospondin type 3 repeat-containing protein [Verrucomicrobiota bacterium]